MIEQAIISKGIQYERLSKKEGIAISRDWLERFASNVREQTGKYTIGNYKWESYWSGIEPALSDSEAIQEYTFSDIEDFYILDESGKNVFVCAACEWKNFRESYIDLYVVPKSMT
ncbi:MAG: hypothetical protein V3T17_11395 [Pseudomonadales bacterium]